MYQPLLAKPANEEITLKPTGLNKGETQFVRDLEQYIKNNKIDQEIYLLRNLTRGKGVGFFEENSFYPDFILWLKEQQKQKIVFIDPKGIVRHSLTDPKLTLHKHLKENIQQKFIDQNVTLDSYIISVTALQTVYTRFNKRPETLAEENHLIFMYNVGERINPKYMDTLFNQLFID